jgi:hypothetical protein
MSVRSMVGDELAKALDVIDDQDDSVTVKVEISSGSVSDQGPPVRHEFSIRVLDGEWQESSHHERWGVPRRPTSR